MANRLEVTRRTFTGTVGLAALGAALGGMKGFAADPRPNIVLIIADNLGRESVGTYGGEIFKTPNIDSIGRDGVVFDCCYIGTPLCSPARVGLLTGRAPYCMGIHGQPVPSRPDEGLQLGEITIAEALKAVGYRTSMFGKWNLGYGEHLLPAYQGFEEYYGVNAGHADYYTHLYDQDGRKYFYHNTTRIDPEGYLDNLCVDRMMDWLKQRRDDPHPFLSVMAFFTPHGPYQSPPGYPSEGNRDQVYGYMIDNMDRQVGRILGQLEKTGKAENTLVFFISDQGASSMNTYRRDLTEGGLQVVCHARWPGRIRSGERSEAPIISYDLFPTFVELAEGILPPDRPLHGRSLVPLLTGKSKGSPHKVLYWTYEGADAIREGNWKLHLTGEKVLGLYDLSRDPEAKEDLAEKHPDRVDRMKVKMAAWKERPGG